MRSSLILSISLFSVSDLSPFSDVSSVSEVPFVLDLSSVSEVPSAWFSSPSIPSVSPKNASEIFSAASVRAGSFMQSLRSCFTSEAAPLGSVFFPREPREQQIAENRRQTDAEAAFQNDGKIFGG